MMTSDSTPSQYANDDLSGMEEPRILEPLAPLIVLPCLTQDLAGIGGSLKESPEDFVVEEIPAYEPSGIGEHLFLWVEKHDVAAAELEQHIAQVLGCSPMEIGVAGLKDRRAVTRQFVSVPAKFEAKVEQITTDSIRVLKATRHGNKLKTGHLKGNRFSILIRNITPETPIEKASRIVERIRQQGIPNFYGPQRFGHDNETLFLGLDLLMGRKKSHDIPESKRRFLRRLSLSAVQSDLFNHALAERLNDGLLHTVLEGDVMEVVASGGKFIAEDAVAEQPRYDMGETAVTGPIFGKKMRSPRGVPFDREDLLLARSGLGPEHFGKYTNLMSGARRPYIVRPGEIDVSQESTGLRLNFTLPTGTYATILLREFMKTDTPAEEVEADQEERE